jgi:hypothetical protein
MSDSNEPNHVQSLRFSSNEPKLEVLDQLLIPHSKVYIDIPDVEAAWSVIRTMQIRGKLRRFRHPLLSVDCTQQNSQALEYGL